jgi:hypothetical protein
VPFCGYLEWKGEDVRGKLSITDELTVGGSLLSPEVVTENLVETLQADGIRLFFLVVANL